MSRNEAQTRLDLIDSALVNAEWNRAGSRIRVEYQINQGRILGGGNRGKRQIADYILEHKGRRLAVIEAKAEDLPYTDGVAQAIEYARKLAIPITYSTNGKKIRQIDMRTNDQKDVDRFPTPQELLELVNEPHNTLLEKLEEVPYPSRGGEQYIRYFHEIAIERTMKALSEGQNRMLLTLATGTGKTRIAFHIVSKLYESRWNLQGDGARRPRILVLADRNILASQAFNEFSVASSFPEDALVRITPKDIAKKGKVPTNGNIFFTIFQTFMTKVAKGNEEQEFNFGEYPKDFFDLIIIDECHRGGANAEGQWRGILEYFDKAVQLGLTATPKRKDNVDTYAYFGDPLYVYSLKDGIEDGFLTPFRVLKYATNIDDYVYVADDEVIEGEVVEGKVYKDADFNRNIVIREREVFRVQTLLAKLPKSEKTLIFCATQAHAGLVRDIFGELKVSQNTTYCVRVTADDGAIGDQYLLDFQDNEKTIPTVLTTSQKLSTGVDARNVRHIVLFRPINSMIEFKQIIGRGTRLFDGKDYFTVHDFVNASAKFSDPEWDGEPEWLEDSIPRPTTTPPKSAGEKDPEIDPPTREKLVIKLADGKKRQFQSMTTTMFYSVDGKALSLSQFIQSLFEKLPDLFEDEEELRRIWSVPKTRIVFLERLSDEGFPKEHLEEIQRLISAEASDLFDVLEYIKYAFAPIERSLRASVARGVLQESMTANEMQFVDFLVAQYLIAGVDELDEPKLQILLAIKYQSIKEGIDRLGSVEVARNIFFKFQEMLYLPHGTYSGSSAIAS
jgi:type I restriction enzyme R subunit